MKEMTDRLFEKVDFPGSWSSCWSWRGSTKIDGYGQVAHAGKTVRAHRAAYECAIGPIGDGLVLDHLCRNRRCVNPLHLEPVTRAENLRRQGAAITHCPAGHEYTPENTGYSMRPSRCRRCLTCDRARNRLRSARRYAATKARRLRGEDQS